MLHRADRRVAVAAGIEDGALVSVSGRRTSKGAIAANLVLGLIGVLFATPMLWMLLASVDSHASWHLELPKFTLSNFGDLMNTGDLRPLLNSLYLAGVSTLVTTVAAVLAAYALSRRHIPFKNAILIVVLFASSLPVTMAIIPTYQLFVEMGWLDSQFWVAMFLAASALPFAIWLMKNFIDSVPTELIEAASMEGAGSLRILRRIVVPLVVPGIGVTAIMTFISSWNAFLIPLVLDPDPSHTPASIAVYNFLTPYGPPRFGQLAAYSILFSLPVLIMYLSMARKLAGAFSFGGSLKG